MHDRIDPYSATWLQFACVPCLYVAMCKYLVAGRTRNSC